MQEMIHILHSGLIINHHQQKINNSVVDITNPEIQNKYIEEYIIENNEINAIKFKTTSQINKSFDWYYGICTVNIICGALINVSINANNKYNTNISDLKNRENLFNVNTNFANNIKNKLWKLKSVFPFKLKHIAKNGNKYDFTCINDTSISLSAKTSKKDGKVSKAKKIKK